LRADRVRLVIIDSLAQALLYGDLSDETG